MVQLDVKSPMVRCMVPTEYRRHKKENRFTAVSSATNEGCEALWAVSGNQLGGYGE